MHIREDCCTKGGVYSVLYGYSVQELIGWNVSTKGNVGHLEVEIAQGSTELRVGIPSEEHGVCYWTCWVSGWINVSRKTVLISYQLDRLSLQLTVLQAVNPRVCF